MFYLFVLGSGLEVAQHHLALCGGFAEDNKIRLRHCCWQRAWIDFDGIVVGADGGQIGVEGQEEPLSTALWECVTLLYDIGPGQRVGDHGLGFGGLVIERLLAACFPVLLLKRLPALLQGL